MLASALLVLVPLVAGSALPERLGLPARWFTALVALSALTAVTHGLGAPRWLALGLTLAAALGAGVVGLWRARPPSRGDALRLGALLVILSIPLLASVAQAIDQPVTAWDAVHIWYYKTRTLLGWKPLAQLKPDPHYPDLGAVAWMLMLQLGAGESVGRSIYAWLYVGAMASLIAVMGRPYRWATVVALGVGAVLSFDADACTNGYQDSLVAATVLVGAGILARLLTKETLDGTARNELLCAGFLCGAAGLVKNEGTFLGVIVSGAFVAVWLLTTGPRRWPQLARPLAPLALAQLPMVLAWPLLQLFNGLNPLSVQGNAFSVSSALGAYHALGRWAAIRPYFDHHLALNHELLSASGILSLGALLLSPRARKPLAFLWAAMSLHLLFVIWVFLSTQQDLAWHLDTAFYRLASQSLLLLLGVFVIGATALAGEVAAAWRRPQ